MRVWRLSGSGCEGGNCPATYATDRGTLLVQGDAVAGEVDAVAVPASLVALHRDAAPDRPLPQTGPAEQATVVLHGRRIRDAAVLESVALPAHEVLIEIDR